ncbi:bifunctional phosphopantothenoylcysteine decarboxylase/phosphopantothenate--cysteine ligase CoaBC [Litoribrevibacter albus]|uniref:bifunctional phosphopantothenoylcysteine decarboxylase/phosphopantothenate--cysteine ligase CoaBC n=1 Tax=Litoribrevibacter albus TaxID=1473156 RepID=UPI0024E05B9F|nr:bifunctional phosphopantothenoylcysteine decarboxylase/phosphopantothenate--cysteine ligase CoaBC [Litoribrevibacter albus]
MSRLQNKRILLGITGGIAAYKCAELVRHYKKAGAEVHVVMTRSAQEFVTPLTLQALSGNPVHTSLLDPEAEAGMGHIELARWADLMVIAPATANFLATLAQGKGDDLLSTICLATKSPIALAPAMNQQMWASPATQNNIAQLKSLYDEQRLIWMGPAEGEQACGDVGPGRMLEPEQITELTAEYFEEGAFTGKHVVITAGPTQEAIDPVRYISNHSSGKMGYALAQAAADQGAQVTLISGPTNLPCPDRVERIQVKSAEQMLEASLQRISETDVFIASAAVADYRPSEIAEHKIKKVDGEDQMIIKLVKNPDIVATVAQHPERPFTVGFAAETQDVAQYAQAKLARKNLDMIVANDVSNTKIGFNSDNNAATVFWGSGQRELELMSKAQMASEILNCIKTQLKD